MQEFQFRPLTAEEHAALDEGRVWAAHMLRTLPPLPPEAVQALYDATLKDFPDHQIAQISTGIIFGDAMALVGELEWVRAVYADGEESCLAPKGVALFCPPISMIQRRIQARETVDIATLAAETLEKLQAAAARPDAPRR
jgi:hypothetical protein